MQCLNTYTGDNVDDANWQNFYADIDGFEFQQGYLKKVKVKKEVENHPTADGSSVKYILLQTLEKKADSRIRVGGKWRLQTIYASHFDKGIGRPDIVIDLNRMQIGGSAGCNGYMGQINRLTAKTITFGNIATTLMACIDKNVERDYLDALSEVDSYRVIDDHIVFYDQKNNEILSYTKAMENKTDWRIHDIWTAVSIMGQSVESISRMPTMEINLTQMKVFGNDGCNDYTGKVIRIADGQITFSNLAATRKMCQTMETPNAFNQAMRQVVAYRLNGLRLLLINQQNEIVLTFLKGD